MSYKLIALDIDGTIRTVERDFSDRTRASISRVAASGAVATLVTGRAFESARGLSSELGIRAPIVSYQGAHVADPVTGRVLLHRTIESSMALAALDALSAWAGDIVVYQGNRAYVTRLSPWVGGYGGRNPGSVQLVGSLREPASQEPTRLLAVGEPDEVHRLVVALKAEFDSRLHITRSLPHFCEILHPDSRKDAALAWLAKNLGVRQDETVAFGNSYEDVGMLRWAGMGVAVSGSVSEALDAADMVGPPIEEDGVAQVLDDLLDRGLIG